MKRLLKLTFALALMAFATFASLNITAQPAEAINCRSQWLGCSFIGHELTPDGYYECCTYGCSDGRIIQGACGVAWGG